MSKIAAKRRTVPTILQMEATECGAASLAMVMAYHKKFVTLEELRVSCGISRDGSKASSIVKAARSYGFIAKGFTKSPQDLLTMKTPMIIHWNHNHFLVLEGFKGKHVYLNDPAAGKRRLTWEEFDDCFTGVVLTFEPGPEFKPDAKKPNPTESLKSYLKGSEMALVYLVLTGLLLVLPGLVVPMFSRIFLDEILLGGKTDWLKGLMIGMVVTLFFQGVLLWSQGYYLQRLKTKLTFSTSSKFLWHVLRLPIAFFSQRYAGDIAQRMESNMKVTALLSGQLAKSILSIFLVIFYLIIMFQYNTTLALVGMFAAITNVLILKLANTVSQDQSQKIGQDQGKVMNAVMSGIKSIETHKATGSENDFFTQWSGYFAKVLSNQQEFGVIQEYLSLAQIVTKTLTDSIVLIYGGYLIIQGEMTIGTLMAFQTVMAGFIGPVGDLTQMGTAIQQMRGDINRLDDVFRYPVDRQFEPNQSKAQIPITYQLKGYVDINGLTFGYNPLDSPLIEDFSLQLKPGQRVALVGSSGSGKSTVAKLVAGIYQPWSGEILFDGIKREELPREVINNSISVVDQDISVFNGSIRENITLWDPTVPDAEVVRAAKDAFIHDEISQRNGGYDYQMLEGGTNFSGGQRQRLEIARALAANPSVLILDEATSALDPVTEKQIDEAVRRRGCTCLIIAHRLSTIRDCDEIIVMERGKIKQRGAHDELKQDQEGLYARLIQSNA
ncbi:MAG: NHLP family bacteriocin export ABC transporter peptidase/permease/ATPase subunit [Bacteroidota bacterium]